MEKGFTRSETTARKEVRELNVTFSQAFISLPFDPGEVIQVDWDETRNYLCGQHQKIYLFCARLCNSGRPISLACRDQNEERFPAIFVLNFELLGETPNFIPITLLTQYFVTLPKG